jgi:hypothetical protein
MFLVDLGAFLELLADRSQNDWQIIDNRNDWQIIDNRIVSRAANSPADLPGRAGWVGCHDMGETAKRPIPRQICRGLIEASQRS